MKRKYVFTALAVLGLVLTGCLDKSPIDPNIEQTFDAQKIYNKAYAGLGLSGQSGPSGDCDTVAFYEGYSVW